MFHCDSLRLCSFSLTDFWGICDCTYRVLLHNIPYLAQGAVIPPNREFLAVLGDQKQGTNIEAPLSTIEQALENVMNRRGYGGEQIIENVLMLDGEVIYRNQKKVSRRHGISLVEGGNW